MASDESKSEGEESESSSTPPEDEYSPVKPAADGAAEIYGLSNAPESWNDPAPVRRVPVAESRQATRRRTSEQTRVLLTCNLLVFLTSVCVMVLELTASRLVARHIGNSIYTWTSVIGVVLAGITLGNFLGGWIADRFDRVRVLPLLFLIASGLCYSVLWIDRLVAHQARPDDWRWSSWVLWLVVECYLLPSMALGTISPVLASVAISSSKKKGMTVGSVYAWGAFGSIVGTFLTGFVLIEMWGTRTIIGSTALALATLSLLTAVGRPALRVLVLFGWSQWIVFTLLVLTATPNSLGQLAFGVARRWNGESAREIVNDLDEDSAAPALELTARRYPFVFDSENWSKAQAQLRVKPDPGRCRELLLAVMSEMDHQDLCQWLNELVAEGLVTSKSGDWLNRGWNVGDHLQRIGFTLWLRDDFPGEYHDESRYSYINVGPAAGHDADTLSLKLDKLVHSYYSPVDPTHLYYEYERVYAAVTELALEKRSASWELDISTLPYLAENVTNGQTELPDDVALDRDRQVLVIQGGVSSRRRESLLSLARSGEYWRTIRELRDQTSSPDWGGFTTIQLERFPSCVEIPDELAKSVSYDRSFKHIVAYARVDRALEDQLIKASSEWPFHAAVDEISDRSRQAETLFLGGGGFVFPRWVEENLGRATTIEVLEIDPAVEEAVRKRLGLPHSSRTRIKTLIGDARLFVDRWVREQASRHGRYNLVYGDAFQDFNIPWHLTTEEFLTSVATLMSDDGLFLVNLIDSYPRSSYLGRRSNVVEREYVGPIPASWKQDALPKRWVSVPGTRRLEFNFQGEGKCLLRMSRSMEQTSLDRLLDDIGTNRPLQDSLEILFEETQLPGEFPGELPTEWFSDDMPTAEWIPVDSAPGIELLLLEEQTDGKQPAVALSFRGIMTDEVRQQLEDDYGSYATLMETVREWSNQPVPRTGRFLGRFVLTISKVFPAVYIFSGSEGPPGDRRDTFVIVASKSPIDLNQVSQTGLWNAAPFASWVKTDDMSEPDVGGQMMSIIGLSESQTLTDDFAPVDNLLAPVFENQDVK